MCYQNHICTSIVQLQRVYCLIYSNNSYNRGIKVFYVLLTGFWSVSFQIDPKAVKWLDRNLFIGEEIKEVYEEIMRTINKDHRLFDRVNLHIVPK